MNTRLQAIIQYKTGGRQNAFAELMGWTPQYITKLTKGKDFGLQPVLKIVETLPELNARWFLTGEGEMLTEDSRSALKRKAIEQAQQIMEVERLIPVMTTEEMKQFEQILLGQKQVGFSPERLSDLTARADERIKGINERFAAAAAKSDELCRQKTAKK